MLSSFLPGAVVLVSLVAMTPREIPPPPPVDTTAVDAFWRLFDVLQSGNTPSPTQWQDVFETDGYKSYLTSGRMEQLFRQAWPVTLGRGRDIDRAALRRAQPAFAPYLQHFAAVAARATDLRAFQASLASSDFQLRARDRAMEFLPAAARLDERWPRIVPVIAEPDGKAVGDMIVIDLLLAADFGPFLSEFVAHEMHHVYGRRLRTWQPRAGDVRPEARLLHAIDQLALEGIADLVDKPALLARGGPFADRYREAYVRAPEDIRNMNTLLEGIAVDSTRMQANAAAIWKSLPFAGHTTGYYMAQTIRDGLGASALETGVRNPLSFIPTYNTAAARLNGLGQSRPLFSADALAVVSSLERAAREDVR